MKVFAFTVSCALLLALCVSVSPFAFAENAVTVKSDTELAAAIENGAQKIIIDYDSPTLHSDAVVSGTLAIDGGGKKLELGEHSLILERTGTLTLANITISSLAEHAIKSSGSLRFDSACVFEGVGGILVEAGSVSSGAFPISFGADIPDALQLGGSASLENMYIWHFGSGAGMRIISDCTVTLKSTATIISESSAAISIAPGCSPVLTAAGSSQLKVSAAEGFDGIYLGEGTITLGDNTQLDISAGAHAIRCGSIKGGSRLLIQLEAKTGLKLSSDFSIGDSASIAIESKSTAISAGAVKTGDASAISINAGDTAIACSSVHFGARSTISITAARAIVSSGEILFGQGSSIDADCSGTYCIYSDGVGSGTDFASDCTVSLKSNACAIYSKGTVTFAVGTIASITGGASRPAVIVDGGQLKFSGAEVSVTSFIAADASINSAVYVNGSVSLENSARVSVTAYEQFGLLIKSGELHSDNSSLYAIGGCAIYGEHCDIVLDSGAQLYAHGTADSGIRLSDGSIAANPGSTFFTQGSRFGAELLGSGSLSLSSCTDYTIRSRKFNALYISNGSFTVSGVDRISVYGKAEKDNSGLWCSLYNEDEPAWLSPCDLYANYSLLRPEGTQEFSSGKAAACDALDFNDAKWSISDYSCITTFTSRPIARPNQFSLPAGRTYSWQLYGYSYLGSGVTYELDNINCEGELVLSSDGKLTYTAHSHTRGVQTFTYTVRDSEGVRSTPAAVDILVSASKPPIAWNMSFETGINEELIGNVTTRDYDGTLSEVVIVTEPQHGDFIMGNDGTFIYTPFGLYSGLDSFSYYAVDAVGDKSATASATIFIGMDKVHRANSMTIITERDAVVTTPLDIVLIQPKQPEEDSEEEPPEPVTIGKVIITGLPTYGTLNLNDDNTVTYTPYEGFAGTDSFTYKFTAGENFESNEAIVTIAIIPGQKPDAVEDNLPICRGIRRRFSLTAQDLDGIVVSYTIAELPQHGTLIINSKTGEATYTPDAGFTGIDSFTFFVTDDEELSSKPGRVTLCVVSLPEYLKLTGNVVNALLILAGGLVIIAALILLPIAAARKRRRELEYIEQLEHELYHDELGDF